MIRNSIALVVGCVIMSVSGGDLSVQIARSHTVKLTDVWYGGERTVFDFHGYDAWVVEPPRGVKVAEGRPWTWTMQWRTCFVPRTGVPKMLETGWHHVSVDTYTNRMDETGLAISARFQEFLIKELGFAPKACLIGMSWGGFFSVRYAARYPKNVAKIYLDCPYLNLGGNTTPIDIGPWAASAPENWIDDPRMPINTVEPIAKANIPILLAYGGADDVLNPKLNSEIFIPRFRRAGGDLRVIYRVTYGHHPHGFEIDETTIPDFFMGRSANQ